MPKSPDAPPPKKQPKPPGAPPPKKQLGKQPGTPPADGSPPKPRNIVPKTPPKKRMPTAHRDRGEQLRTRCAHIKEQAVSARDKAKANSPVEALLAAPDRETSA
eukprot:10600278-Alexandrium_andersonii.AAC.1